MLKGRPLMNLIRLKDEGCGIREISRITGYSRNTVRKYLRDPATAAGAEAFEAGAVL